MHIHNAIRAFAFLLICAMTSVPLPSEAGPAEVPPAASGQRVEEPATKLGGYARETVAEKLASCMALWEPATHMTRQLWKTVCKRIQTND